jgi:hypothetical protein
MFLLSRRQTRTALAAATGAAVYLAASELGKDKLKMTGLFVLASASMAGMVTAQSSSKAKNVETRLAAHVAATAPAVNLVANGGTIGGSLTVSGDHHVSGSLYGASGTLSIGDGTHVVGNSFTSDGRITGHDDAALDTNQLLMAGHALTIFRGTPAANSAAIVTFLQTTGLSQ